MAYAQNWFINQAHPLAAGLHRTVLFDATSFSREIVSGTPLVPNTNTVVIQGMDNGMAGAHNGGQVNNFVKLFTPASIRNQTKFSICAYIQPIALVGAYDVYYQETLDGSNNSFVWIILDSAAKFSVAFKVSGTTNEPKQATAVRLGQTYCIVGTFDSVADVFKLYVDGKLEGTTSTSVAGFPDTDNFIPSILGPQPDNTHQGNGYFGGLYTWRDRVLTPEDAMELTNEPYTFFLKPYWLGLDYFTPAEISLIINDSLSLSDGLAPQRVDNYDIFNEQITFSDSASIQIPIIQEFIDALNLSDSAAVDILGILGQIADDTLTFADAVNLLIALQQEVGDSFTLSDSIVLGIANFLTVELEDSLLFSDSVRLQFVRALVFGETLSLGDLLEITNAIQLVVGDSFTFSDSVSGTNPPTPLSINVSSVLTLSDGVTINTRDYLVSYLRRYLNDVLEPPQ